MVAITLIIALIGVAAWGLMIGRRIRLSEFTSNRSQGNWRDIFFTLMGSLVGGWMFFGLTAVGYEAGTVGIVIGIGYCIGLILLATCVPRIKTAMNKYDCDTMDDFIGAIFGRRVQAIVSITNFFFFLAVVAAQFIAMISYLRIVAPTCASWLPILAALVVIAYTTVAGYKGVILTDFVQLMVLTLGSICLFVVVLLNTSWSSVQSIANTHFPPTGYGYVFFIGALVLFPPTLLVRSDLWQRIAHASSATEARKAMFLTAPFLLIFYVMFTLIGIMARAELGPGVSAESSGLAFFHSIVVPEGASSLAGTLLVSVVSLGIFAALLSTADTNINIGALALTKLLLPHSWSSFSKEVGQVARFEGSRTQGESRLLRAAQLMSVFLGLLALGGALVFPDIVSIMVACASILMIFLPSTISALFAKARSRLAAFLSIALGLVIYVVAALCLSNTKTAFLPSTVVAILVFFVFNRRKQNNAQSE